MTIDDHNDDTHDNDDDHHRRTENLEQLRDTIVSLGLEHVSEKHIGNCAADKCPVTHELAIQAMEACLEVVTLPWVLGVEEADEIQAELLGEDLLAGLGFDVWADDEAQEKFIHNLQVRPGRLQGWFIFLRVETVATFREGTKHIGRYHVHQGLHEAVVGQVGLLCICTIHKVHQLE